MTEHSGGDDTSDDPGGEPSGDSGDVPGGDSGDVPGGDSGGPVDDPTLALTPARVAAEREWVRDRAGVVVPLANEVRAQLAAAFDADVDPITAAQYRSVVDETFADGDRAVNVAALVALLRGLDVDGDYPGFVVDEWLGRELAATIAGRQPLRLLAEATFHYADVHYHGPADVDGAVAATDPSHADTAGLDDLDAALAAGVQTSLPGWDWTEGESPFAVAPDED